MAHREQWHGGVAARTDGTFIFLHLSRKNVNDETRKNRTFEDPAGARRAKLNY